LRFGQGLVDFQPVLRFQPLQAASYVVLAVLLAGCSSEQQTQESISSLDAASTNHTVEVPATPVAELEQVQPTAPTAESAPESAIEPAPVSDPLSLTKEPTLDADPPAVTAADEIESVDDILAELNAIKLDGEGGNTLGDPDKVVELMHKGNALISDGQPDAALAKYNDALKFAEKGGDSEVFYNMGIAYKAKGELDKAAAEYRRALELTPKYAEALNNLGNILKDQKKYDEAIRHFESSIRIFPDNPNTHNNLGTAYAIKGDVNRAAVCFAKAVRLQPSYIDARQNLGLAYMQQDRLDVAEKEFSEAFQMARGVMLYEEKRLETARKMKDQAETPGSPLTYQQRNKAGGELDAAEQATGMANAKYQRSLRLLQNVRARRQTIPNR